MRILMLLEVNYPPDSRVEKEMISLSQNGHDVTLACISHDKSKNRIEKTEHYTIYRKYIPKRIFDKVRPVALMFPYYFLWWKKFIRSIYTEFLFDAIHVHDLPLSKTAYFFKDNFKVKLICDQHEYYSDWIVQTAHMNTSLGKIVKALSNWKKYESKYLSLADLVITVAEPLRENYLKEYNLNSKTILTIPNTPTERIFNKKNINEEIVTKYANDFVIFYAGGLDILRGINTAINALPKLREKIPNVQLVLGGKLAKQYNPIKTAEEIGVSDIVSFVGWIDEQNLPSYMAASNVCFFTPPANRDEINKTIATKIYQYAMMQKPIIVSDAKMMKEFVEQNKLGISIHSGNSEEFAEAVLRIYSNTNSYKRNHVKSDWYWEDTVKPMLKSYKKQV